jgi:hypothetical protein
MQKCPRCGYNEGTSWTLLVQIFAFTLLGSAFMSSDVRPRVRLLGEFGIVLFFAAAVWRRISERGKPQKSELNSGERSQ